MNRTPADILNELLILRCQNGEVAAFEELFKQWQPSLFRHACQLTKHQEAAADIVQDSWLVMVKTLRKLDDPARFRSWAYRIVTNKVVDWVRQQQRTRSTLSGVARQTGSAEEDVSSAGKQHLLGQLQTAMQMLPQNNEQSSRCCTLMRCRLQRFQRYSTSHPARLSHDCFKHAKH